MRIYVDTSVINGIYGQDEIIRTKTVQFFKNVNIQGYTLYGSEVTIDEINNTPQKSKRVLLKKIIEKYNIEFLTLTKETRHLATEYIKAKIIPKKYFADALHIAIAVIYNIPVLVSWNFEHMVKVKTRLEITEINRRLGMPIVEIATPEEV